MKTLTWIVAAALAAGSGAAAAQAQRGVSADQILIGSIQDLSGPLAGFGKQTQMGMMLRVDEINEQGGIHGRKLRLLIEDAGYDPKRAALAAEKLVNRDGIFAMVGHIGTAHNMAAMPIQFDKNVINFFPLTGGREMYEPPNRLKYAFIASYFDQMQVAVPKLVREKNASKVCTMYQDDEAGLELVRGAEAGLKSIGMEFVERASFKRGATEFATQMTKLQGAGCDFVVLGTVIRETVGGIAAARRLNFAPVFLAGSAAYTELIPKLGGPAMNGLYATHTAQHPYLDDAAQPIRFWAGKYKTKFGDDPTVFSVYGYTIIDAFAQAAGKAGRTLTTDSFIRAMDSVTLPADLFGAPPMSFSPTRRLGNPETRLSQIQNGKWVPVSGYLPVPGKR